MNSLLVPMTAKERHRGFLCLALHLLILPLVLPQLNALLSQPLSLSEANFLFYSVSFLCTVTLLFGFLRGNCASARRRVYLTLRTAFFAFVAFRASTVVLGILIQRFFPQFANINDQSIESLLKENYPLIAFATVFLVPVTEETLYRGLIFGTLSAYGKALAYGVSATVFAAIHVVGYLGVYPGTYLLLCFVQYLPAGLALAWAYCRTGTLIAPILVHMTVNAMGLSQMR